MTENACKFAHLADNVRKGSVMSIDTGCIHYRLDGALRQPKAANRRITVLRHFNGEFNTTGRNQGETRSPPKNRKVHEYKTSEFVAALTQNVPSGEDIEKLARDLARKRIKSARLRKEKQALVEDKEVKLGDDMPDPAFMTTIVTAKEKEQILDNVRVNLGIHLTSESEVMDDTTGTIELETVDSECTAVSLPESLGIYSADSSMEEPFVSENIETFTSSRRKSNKESTVTKTIQSIEEYEREIDQEIVALGIKKPLAAALMTSNLDNSLDEEDTVELAVQDESALDVNLDLDDVPEKRKRDVNEDETDEEPKKKTVRGVEEETE
jgi:hypothetical protein